VLIPVQSWFQTQTFNIILAKHGEFKVVVDESWSKEVHSLYPIHVLHTKVSRTAEALKRWNKEKIRWTVFASNVATQIIVNLDLAQEERQLSQEERQLRRTLNTKLLAFAAIERSRWRQRSRMTWIKE
jgi:hypothetical protein